MSSFFWKSIIILGIFTFIFAPLTSQAVKIDNPLKAQSFAELIDGLIGFFVTIGVVVAPLVILYAGFLLVTSAGEPEKVENAKNLILYCVIGLLILFLGKGLISVIRDIFQVKGP